MAQAPARPGYPPRKELKPPIPPAKRVAIGDVVRNRGPGQPDIAIVHRCFVMGQVARP